MNPVSGKMPIEEFRKLKDAPYGAAIKTIRKYDPCWGVKPGEKIKWTVTATARIYGDATVEACSQEEAVKLADALPDNAFDWDVSDRLEILIDEVAPE